MLPANVKDTNVNPPAHSPLPTMALWAAWVQGGWEPASVTGLTALFKQTGCNPRLHHQFLQRLSSRGLMLCLHLAAAKPGPGTFPCQEKPLCNVSSSTCAGRASWETPAAGIENLHHISLYMYVSLYICSVCTCCISTRRLCRHSQRRKRLSAIQLLFVPFFQDKSALALCLPHHPPGQVCPGSHVGTWVYICQTDTPQCW